MSRAVDEVKALPQYITNGGEVCVCNSLYFICFSGLLLMLVMTQLLMPTIQQFHVFLEGTFSV